MMWRPNTGLTLVLAPSNHSAVNDDSAIAAALCLELLSHERPFSIAICLLCPLHFMMNFSARFTRRNRSSLRGFASCGTDWQAGRLAGLE